jgi:hypothetical protein
MVAGFGSRMFMFADENMLAMYHSRTACQRPHGLEAAGFQPGSDFLFRSYFPIMASS